ncbi:hypothetical protein A3A84_03390 [Candidatus Collierbacteria bacterium RIFCSPLOWO2_01_FULL_50_23]|nr:MAG: hypothetical protein A3F39_02140 [Candidatus Berkelbacteria bacterium RIFCSPHIGHO2_12_FULL_50_11]OGD74867.1 MAG: hypothetical protein A3A84_03390 [Candidatus Collierbacteria bacterium RIFCSPLOWO2_01_FULL_50_23]
MYNWSTDTKKLRQDRQKYSLWKLENLINFGLNKAKISRKSLIKNLPKLDLDPKKKRFLDFLLKSK